VKSRLSLKYAPPAGPVLSILLIGSILLSGLLYYRAIKIQRFLEPALALSQPRNEFTKNIRAEFQKEFGTRPVRGLAVKGSSLFLEKSLLVSQRGTLRDSAHTDLRKLARIFLALMKDEHARSDISLVLIVGRYSPYGKRGQSAAERVDSLRLAGFIQDGLFQMAPELGIRYPTYFAAAAQPSDPGAGAGGTVELRIIPSEFLHIEVLEKLEKYSY
jgi:hypothetical protein